jgi:serine/threonine-protein kinase RsbW
MLQRIYAHGGFPRDLGDAAAAAAALPAASDLRASVYPEWSEASLTVLAYGRDLPDVVRARLRELCVRRIDWIGLDLPLAHPAAALLCAPLEALGFFFAGVVPELADGDVLRLQYLNNLDVDVDAPQIASDFGKELYAYVVRARPA